MQNLKILSVLLNTNNNYKGRPVPTGNIFLGSQGLEPHSTFTAKEIGEIKWVLCNYPKVSNSDIAKHYNTSLPSVSRISRGKIYDKVPFCEPRYDVESKFSFTNVLSEQDAGEIKWIMMNVKPRPPQHLVADEYGLASHRSIGDITNGNVFKQATPTKPDSQIIESVKKQVKENDNSRRSLTHSQASKVKWIVQNTAIRSCIIGEYFGVSEQVISYIRCGASYKGVKPQKPAYNPQDEFIRELGKDVNLYSKRLFISTLEMAQIRWLAENAPIHNRAIEDQYNCNRISGYKNMLIWYKVEPRKPDLSNVFDSFDG